MVLKKQITATTIVNNQKKISTSTELTELGKQFKLTLELALGYFGQQLHNGVFYQSSFTEMIETTISLINKLLSFFNSDSEAVELEKLKYYLVSFQSIRSAYRFNIERLNDHIPQHIDDATRSHYDFIIKSLLRIIDELTPKGENTMPDVKSMTFYGLHYAKEGQIMIAQMSNDHLQNMVIYLLKQIWEIQLNQDADLKSIDPISRKIVGKMYQQHQKDQDNKVIALLAKLNPYWLEYSLRGLATLEMVQFLQTCIGRSEALPDFSSVNTQKLTMALPEGINYNEANIDYDDDVYDY